MPHIEFTNTQCPPNRSVPSPWWRTALAITLMASLSAHAGQDDTEHNGLFSLSGIAAVVGVGETLNAAHQAHCKQLRDQGLDEPASCARPTVVDNANRGLSNLIQKVAASTKLRKNLVAARSASGSPPPPKWKCDAHHIVPEGDNRDGRQEYAQEARNAIRGCIDLNASLSIITVSDGNGLLWRHCSTT